MQLLEEGMCSRAVLPLLKKHLALLSGGRDRRGGPVLTFRSSPLWETVSYDDLKQLVCYLSSIPSEEVQLRKFSVIIDMRGLNWTTIKPVLRVLEDTLGDSIHAAYIMKPDKFWQKQKTTIWSSKVKFETHMISVDDLTKYIENSQITSEFDGTLTYDHDDWIDLRMEFEDFVWRANDLLGKLDLLRVEIGSSRLPDNVDSARAAIEDHQIVQNKIARAPIGAIKDEGNKLLHRISTVSLDSSDSGYSSCSSRNSMLACNSDFQAVRPKVFATLDMVTVSRQKVQEVWDSKLKVLEQCLVLNQFSVDVDKLLLWMSSNSQAFLQIHTNIGTCKEEAGLLKEEHDKFVTLCVVEKKEVERLLDLARRLVDSRHYASDDLQERYQYIQDQWTSFSTAVEERSELLILSVHFHEQSESFFSSVVQWTIKCNETQIPDNYELLEDVKNEHQQLYETMSKSYGQICTDGKALLEMLQSPVHPQRPGSTSLTATSDFSEAVNHILGLIHKLFDEQRDLESLIVNKHKTLQNKLEVWHFQQDVSQVLCWIEHHGEPFLKRHTGIGKSLHKASALFKRHEEFEKVAQNTYSNAKKLMASAQQLIQAWECGRVDIEDIATMLESNVKSFIEKVNYRRQLLQCSVLFHTHIKELSLWFSQHLEMLTKHDSPETFEESDSLVRSLDHERGATLDAIKSTQHEGFKLVEDLKCLLIDSNTTSSAILHIDSLIKRLDQSKTQLEELWSARRIRLDLFLKLRMFEADAIQVSSRIESMTDQLKSCDPMDAARHYKSVNDETEAGVEIIRRGDNLYQVIESTGLVLMSDSNINAQTRIQILLGFMNEKIQDILYIHSLQQSNYDFSRQMEKYESFANEVLVGIKHGETMLDSLAVPPNSLKESEISRKEHEQFQFTIEETHKQARSVQKHAESLLQSNHRGTDKVRLLAEAVAEQWQLLMSRAEDRFKLITGAYNFYHTTDSVHSVLESLDANYSNIIDACHTKDQYTDEQIAKTLVKHTEQKDAFLKASNLARSFAETFVKFLNRSTLPSLASKNSPDIRIRNIMEHLKDLEFSVLEKWTKRKSQLEQCQQYILFERSAKETLSWISDTGNLYLSTHTYIGNSRQQTEALLHEHNEFKSKAKGRRNDVQLQLQLANCLVENGHIHAESIKTWVTRLDEEYNKFSISMESYRNCLEKSLGRDSEKCDLSLEKFTEENNIDDVKLRIVNKQLSEDRRRSAKKREFIMNELLTTERTYVKDLKACIKYYMREMVAASTTQSLPSGLQNKQQIVFGNIEQICEFHEKTFLPDLERFSTMPEDVGHCFLSWASNFRSLYVSYCKTKSASNLLVANHSGSFFDDIQKRENLEMTIASYLIKPVQRITKYQLLLNDLSQACHDKAEIKEAYDVMKDVPKKANDAINLSMLEGQSDNHLAAIGEVILQDSFQLWASKQLIKKGRDRHLFLFDSVLIISKETKDSQNNVKYQFKSKHFISDLNISEHLEGDETKFGFWAGSTPNPDNRIILKASTLEVKLDWVRKLREVIQQLRNVMHPALLESVKAPISPEKQQLIRHSKDSDDLDLLCRNADDNLTLRPTTSNPDSLSLTSNSTQATSTSDRGAEFAVVALPFKGVGPPELTVKIEETVEVLENKGEWTLARNTSTDDEGWMPTSYLKAYVRRSSFDFDESDIKQADVTQGKKKGSNLIRKWLASPSRRTSTVTKLTTTTGMSTEPIRPKKSLTTKRTISNYDQILSDKNSTRELSVESSKEIDRHSHSSDSLSDQMKLDTSLCDDDDGDLRLPPPMSLNLTLTTTPISNSTG